MTMPFRDFALNNFRWKFTALLLAMLVWFVIKFAIYKGGGHDQILPKQPVMLLRAPDDTRVFRISPPQVDLIIQSPQELDAGDFEVFVDLTSMPDVEMAYKQVLVRGAEAAKVVVVKPPGVTVERIFSPESTLTNVFRKP